MKTKLAFTPMTESCSVLLNATLSPKNSFVPGSNNIVCICGLAALFSFLRRNYKMKHSMNKLSQQNFRKSKSPWLGHISQDDDSMLRIVGGKKSVEI